MVQLQGCGLCYTEEIVPESNSEGQSYSFFLSAEGANEVPKQLFLDEKLVIECYREGFPSTQIARLFECSKPVILRILHSNGVEIRKAIDYRPFGNIEKSGYIRTRRGGNGKKRLAHHLVVEEHLGRFLCPGETVHHIDGNRANNLLDNLQLRNSAHGPGQIWQCNSCGSNDVSAVEL